MPMLVDVGLHLARRTTAAIGLIFTRPKPSSKEISGALARVGDSTRRMPVTQAL